MQHTRKTILGLVGLMTLAGALALFGCGGDDNEEPQVSATANAVNNKTFAFSSGEIFNPALRNVATTLAFSNNGANFTLTSAGGTATGTSTFGSCILTVTSSTYASGVGPQANAVITLEPCTVDSATNVLTVSNGAITVRGAASGTPPPPSLGAFQVDRAGRVGITTAVTDPFFRETVSREQTKHDIVNDDYNAESDPFKWVSRFSSLIAPNLAILDALDMVCGNQLAAGAPGANRYKTLADILADDQLYLNTATGKCTQYLAVEAGITDDCGGRTPNYNTIDVTYCVLASGTLTCPITNGVLKDDDGTHSTTVFPFIDNPVPFVKK
jgi:hypothetical protein